MIRGANKLNVILFPPQPRAKYPCGNSGIRQRFRQQCCIIATAIIGEFPISELILCKDSPFNASWLPKVWGCPSIPMAQG
jgi:hypothetical protein